MALGRDGGGLVNAVSQDHLVDRICQTVDGLKRVSSCI